MMGRGDGLYQAKNGSWSPNLDQEQRRSSKSRGLRQPQ